MRQLRSLMNSCARRGFFANRDPGGNAAPRLYLPVSRPLASGKDVAPCRPLELAGVIHREAELAREHDRLALLAENSSEPLLRAAFVAVAVGGVDQVDAELDRLAYDAARRRKIDAAAEIVA